MRSRRWPWRLQVTLALLVACGASVLGGPLREATAQGQWTPTGTLGTARARHSATLLPSGQVLVAGGVASDGSNGHLYLRSAELYDPATGQWTPTGQLGTARLGHTATLLPSGQVLVVGGQDGTGINTAMNSAELYDPATGQWTPTGALSAEFVADGLHTATRLPSGKVLVVSQLSAELYDPATGRWTPTGPLNEARLGHTATLLPSGQVLVAGGDYQGSNNGAELYDPVSGQWTPTGSLGTGRVNHTAVILPSGEVVVVGGIAGPARSNSPSSEFYDPAMGRWTPTGASGDRGYKANHTATLLPSGQVLVVGGQNNQGGPLFSAELYDPATAQWTPTGMQSARRWWHTATLLPSGRVLVVGGFDESGNPLGSAELYDPAIGRWTPTGALATARVFHTATLLPSGQVLVVGGRGSDGRAELCDPATGRSTTTGALAVARELHTATLLPSGQVLVAGGVAGSNALNSAELYDPATGRWTATGALATGRADHTATLLPSGQVLVAGGVDGNNVILGSAELYDPATGRWTATGALSTGRYVHTATLLPSGRVLAAGGLRVYGCCPGVVVPGAELYDPATGRWTATGALATGRANHTATLLPSGQVLVAGGADAGVLNLAEVYDPATGRWTTIAPLSAGRFSHTATLLPSGEVLVAAGVDSNSVILGSVEIHDPSPGVQSAWRPNLTFVAPAAVGSALGVEGSLFLGLSEASGGSTQQSATNYPLVQLRRLDNEQTRFLLPDASEPWTDSTFTSLPLAAFPPGPALVTVITNGIPSVAKSIVVRATTLGALPPESLRLGPVHVSPRQVARGDIVEVVTTLRAGGTAVPHLTVFLYDGDPESGGRVFRIKRVGSLGADEAREVRVPFRATRCGTYHFVVIAGKGTPFEAERTARPLHVDCGSPDPQDGHLLR